MVLPRTSCLTYGKSFRDTLNQLHGVIVGKSETQPGFAIAAFGHTQETPRTQHAGRLWVRGKGAGCFHAEVARTPLPDHVLAQSRLVRARSPSTIGTTGHTSERASRSPSRSGFRFGVADSGNCYLAEAKRSFLQKLVFNFGSVFAKND